MLPYPDKRWQKENSLGQMIEMLFLHVDATSDACKEEVITLLLWKFYILWRVQVFEMNEQILKTIISWISFGIVSRQDSACS